jgi:hypothetical protein
VVQSIRKILFRNENKRVLHHESSILIQIYVLYIKIEDSNVIGMVGFPLVPFVHIISSCSGFISNVLLFKSSSLTLISIDNCSVTDAILCSWHFYNDNVANPQHKISKLLDILFVICLFFPIYVGTILICFLNEVPFVSSAFFVDRYGMF